MTGTRLLHHLVLTFAGLTLVALLGGCGSVPQPPQEPAAQPWITADVVAEEYDDRAAQLTLGPGGVWPADPTPPDEFDGEPVRYQVGYGRRQAEFHWYCSWATAAVADEASPQQRRRALREAVRIREMRYYTASLNQRNQRFFDRVLDHALAGDLTPLARDVRLNCGDEIG